MTKERTEVWRVSRDGWIVAGVLCAALVLRLLRRHPPIGAGAKVGFGAPALIGNNHHNMAQVQPQQQRAAPAPTSPVVAPNSSSIDHERWETKPADDASGAAPSSRSVDDSGVSTMVLTGHPDSPRTWVNSLREHVPVLLMLARKDFQTRYKRATFGVLWAVAVPLLQASIMAVVFSRVVRVGTGPAYGVHVMAGVIPFTYFSSVLTMGATSIVEGSGLTEKVWFPRAILVIVPALSNLVGLLVTISVLLIATPILGGHLGVHTLLLVPATLLLIAFATSLALVLSALHVYFRDVKFLVQAALLVWMYVTPILYPPTFLGRLKDAIYANPLTGIVLLFQKATAGSTGPWRVPVLVSVAVTAVLFVVGAEAHRRHDRLFVDLL